MSSFQEYWGNRGHNILMDELNSGGLWSLTPEDRDRRGRQVLARGLRSIYEQWAAARRRIPATPSRASLSSSPPGTASSRTTRSSLAVTPATPMASSGCAIRSGANSGLKPSWKSQPVAVADIDVPISVDNATGSGMSEHLQPQEIGTPPSLGASSFPRDAPPTSDPVMFNADLSHYGTLEMDFTLPDLSQYDFNLDMPYSFGSSSGPGSQLQNS